MSEENVELVRQGYDDFAQTGGTDFSIYSPDVEWHNAAEDPYAEPFQGVEGLRRLLHEVRDSIDDFRTEPFEYLDGGAYAPDITKLQNNPGCNEGRGPDP